MRKTLLCLVAIIAIAVGAVAGSKYKVHRAEQAAVATAQRVLSELVVVPHESSEVLMANAARSANTRTAAVALPAQTQQRVRLAPSKVSCVRSGACEVVGAVTIHTRLADGKLVERTAEVAVSVGSGGEVERVDFYDSTSRG